eukprot:313916_1
MPSIGVAQAKVKARNNQMAQNKKRKTQFENNISDDVGAFGTGNVVTDKYKQKMRGQRRHRKKGGGATSSSNKRSVQFSTNASDVNDDTSLDKDDTLSPLGQLKNLRITAEKGALRSGPKE